MPANPDTWRAIRAELDELDSLPEVEWSLFRSSDSPGWVWLEPDDLELRVRAMAIFLKAARTRGYDTAGELLDELSNAEFVGFRLSGRGVRTLEDKTPIPFEAGLLRDVVKRAITLVKQLEAECTPKEDPPPKPKQQGRKRGPQPQYEKARKVESTAARVAPNGDWRAKWDEVCEALDNEGIATPKRWRAEDREQGKWLRWADCTEKPFAVKAIEYQLESAKKQRRAASTTLK
jgi:hypothetical protein